MNDNKLYKFSFAIESPFGIFDQTGIKVGNVSQQQKDMLETRLAELNTSLDKANKRIKELEAKTKGGKK